MSTLYDVLGDCVEPATTPSPQVPTCPACGQPTGDDARRAVVDWHDRHMADVQVVCRIVASDPGILRQALRRALHEVWGRPKPANHARATAAINDAQALGWIRVEDDGPGRPIHHYPTEAVAR